MIFVVGPVRKHSSQGWGCDVIRLDGSPFFEKGGADRKAAEKRRDQIAYMVNETPSCSEVLTADTPEAFEILRAKHEQKKGKK